MDTEHLQLAQKVHILLKESGFTIAAAESLTAGNVQASLAAVSGASTFFRGGVTAYTAEMKAKLFGFALGALKQCDCVSPQIAKGMAQGAQRMFGADIGVATTGYADGDNPYAFVAIATPGDRVRLIKVTADETARKSRLAMQRLVTVKLLEELIAVLVD